MVLLQSTLGNGACMHFLTHPLTGGLHEGGIDVGWVLQLWLVAAKYFFMCGAVLAIFFIPQRISANMEEF